MQRNKEVVTISLDFILISCLLITPQVLSLNVLNRQRNNKLRYRVINAIHTNKKGRIRGGVIVSVIFDLCPLGRCERILLYRL